MTNIFQTPWLLLSISLVLLIVVTVVRQNSPEKSLWWLLLLPLVTAVLALGLDCFIKTDFEKVKHTIKCARNAVVAEDAGALGTTLAPDYSDRSHNSRKQLINFMQSFFTTTKINKAPQTTGQIVINAPTATAENVYRVHVEPNSAYAPAATLYYVKVRLRLTKNADAQWLINGCELMELNFQPFHWGNL